MFQLRSAGEDEKRKLFAVAHALPLSSPRLLTLADGPTGTLPRGFVHDLSRSHIGQGQRTFEAARAALERWERFDPGWVKIANGNPPIAPGQSVAVDAHTAGLWSIDVGRITETVDTATRFGFLYTTTTRHVEEGQERFVIELTADDSVTYLIEAISRPRHILARLGYAYSRAMQKQFARDSHARMISKCGAERPRSFL